MWDDRQQTLATSVTPSAAVRGGTRMTPQQVTLFLRATGVTVVISSLAMLLAIVGGLLLSIGRRYGGAVLHAATGVYIELFRGTPVLLQLYVLYYGLAPIVALDAFSAAILGLGLNYAAYEAEIYRAGSTRYRSASPRRRWRSACRARMALRRVVLPQALRIALPGITNDFIALLKDTSLVSVITVVELTKQMTITAVDVRSWLVPGALCAALYLALELPALAFGAPPGAPAQSGAGMSTPVVRVRQLRTRLGGTESCGASI